MSPTAAVCVLCISVLCVPFSVADGGEGPGEPAGIGDALHRGDVPYRRLRHRPQVKLPAQLQNHRSVPHRTDLRSDYLLSSKITGQFPTAGSGTDLRSNYLLNSKITGQFPTARPTSGQTTCSAPKSQVSSPPPAPAPTSGQTTCSTPKSQVSCPPHVRPQVKLPAQLPNHRSFSRH